MCGSLRRENISLPELRSIARRQGFPDLGAVHTAVLETNGVVSMFREDEPGTYHPDETGRPADRQAPPPAGSLSPLWLYSITSVWALRPCTR